MVQSQFSLSWDSYKSSICKGFSSLQQNGEFVDMTLAADGYYVKVHQILLALASPYLKELISSAPCQHPVLFLNNVSYKTLASLLEYIYTGEVLVAAESLSEFAEAAKSLHIKGLENIASNNMTVKMSENISQMEDVELRHVSGIKRLVPENEKVEQMNLPASARKVCLKRENTQLSASVSTKKYSPLPTVSIIKSNVTIASKDVPPQDYEPMDDSVAHDDDDDDFENDDGLRTVESKQIVVDKSAASTNLQFTVSIRGSLQIILNRYIYNLHSCTRRTGVRRWRCVDYRNHKCSAIVVTRGNVVLNRGNLHNHSFHDKKILSKIEKKCVYSALDDVQGYKDKDEIKIADADDFISMDEFNDMADKTSDFMKET